MTGTANSAEVCRLTGATYRQLDNSTRTGAIQTISEPGSGYRRQFELDEALVLAALVRLQDLLGGFGNLRHFVPHVRAAIHDGTNQVDLRSAGTVLSLDFNETIEQMRTQWTTTSNGKRPARTATSPSPA